MGLWCSWLNIPSLQDGDEKCNAGSNPASPTKRDPCSPIGRGIRLKPCTVWVRIPSGVQLRMWGNGRPTRFRIWCLKGRASSSLAIRTKR